MNDLRITKQSKIFNQVYFEPFNSLRYGQICKPKYMFPNIKDPESIRDIHQYLYKSIHLPISSTLDTIGLIICMKIKRQL